MRRDWGEPDDLSGKAWPAPFQGYSCGKNTLLRSRPEKGMIVWAWPVPSGQVMHTTVTFRFGWYQAA